VERAELNIRATDKRNAASHGLPPPARSGTGATNRYAPLHWFMTSKEWTRTLLAAVMFGILFLPLYYDISMWIGFGIVLGAITFINIAMASRFVLPLPQIIIMVACIQLILAAWGNQYFPSYKPHFDIGYRIGEYMSYAGPVVAALALGLFIPLRGIHGGLEYFVPTVTDPRLRDSLVGELQKLFILGIVAKFVSGAAPGSLRFFMELAGLLSYVALFGLMLLYFRDWKKYAVLLLSFEFVYTLASGSFHGLLLWGMTFVLVFSYVRKWGRKTVYIMAVGLFSVLVLQAVKEVYRDHFWYGADAGYSQTKVMAFVGMTKRLLALNATHFSRLPIWPVNLTGVSNFRSSSLDSSRDRYPPSSGPASSKPQPRRASPSPAHACNRRSSPLTG